MVDYQLGDVLYEGSTWKTYAAWSKRYEKDVLVKAYECREIMSAEPLIKEAIRQAREKLQEDAVLTDVLLEKEDASGTDSKFTVNFVLEKKSKVIPRNIIERDDSAGRFPAGISDYETVKYLKPSQHAEFQVARKISTGQEVIIKSMVEILEIKKANSLVKEAFVQAYLEHERIPKLFDICFTKTPGYQVFDVHLVMERLQRDLNQDIAERTRISNRYYSELELISILKDVIAGLTHAKSLQIAHRDIKPHNIFIGSDGRVKLGDFGSTWKKVVDSMTASLAGTLDYLSPEMREALKSDSPLSNINPFISDVYSLGVTLLHLALLKSPWDMDSRESIEECLRRRIGEIAYSENLKQLISAMVASQSSGRITLEEIFKLVEEPRLEISENREEDAEEQTVFISTENPATLDIHPIVSEAVEEQKKSTTQKMCQLKNEAVRFFDFERNEWMNAVRLKAKIPVDEGTCYTLDNDTIYFFGNWRKEFTGHEAGTVDCHGSEYAITPLPNMMKERMNAGGIVYENKIFLFGGRRIQTKIPYFLLLLHAYINT